MRRGAGETLRRALQAHPGDTATRLQLAAVLEESGRVEEALAEALRAAGEAPMDLAAAERVAAIQLKRGDMEGAWEAYRRLARAMPRREEPYRLWAQAATRMGDVERAAGVLRQGLEEAGRTPALLEALCYTLNFVDLGGVDLGGIDLGGAWEAAAQETLERHRELGSVVAAGRGGVAGGVGSVVSKGGGDGRVRVGILSGDVCFHACAFFLAGLVAHLDRAKFDLRLYASNEPDETTRNFAALVPLVAVGRASDEALNGMLRAEGLDVLIDASGWTGRGRLPAMCPRVAPLQVTYLGYPNTTGLPGIDARIVDDITDPPGAERWHTERLIHLPRCFVAFTPPGEMPGPEPTPYGRGDAPAPTFGSFSRLAKLQRGTLEAWAEVLRRTPGSRLLLKTEATAAGRAGLEARFAQAGGDVARLDWAPFEPDPAAHLRAYRRVDVALDAFPYNGTTTTCEALLMGVPVVTLAGPVHRARVGASLCHAAGLPQLVAGTREEYVQLAADLGADRARLGAVREGLSGRVRASALCDGRGLAVAVGGAILEALRGAR